MERSIEEVCEAILRKELVPALGCTEPIAIAYAAALARETLGAFPERMTIRCSGNVVKNVKGVVVPGTGDLRGVEASAILGAVGGDASLRLEVLSGLRPEHLERGPLHRGRWRRGGAGHGSRIGGEAEQRWPADQVP